MPPTVRTLALRTIDEAERELAARGLDPQAARTLAPACVHRILMVEGADDREARLIHEEGAASGVLVAVAGKSPEGDPTSSHSLILGGTLSSLRGLSARLSHQSFSLPLLSRELERLLDLDALPTSRWKMSRRTLDLAERPCIMGILNVTPDSFSDGRSFYDIRSAVEHALEMEAEGADIIDIGGESTRPNAPPVDSAEELRRVIPVVESLAGKLRIPISVDTYKAVVARESLAAGAEIVNDISGLTFDAAMASTVAAAGAGLVVMHTRGRPEEMQKNTSYTDVVSEVILSLRNSLSLARAAGIAEEHVVVDPGIGFGKGISGNLEILRRLGEFACLGRPILVGTSRKSFIGAILGREVGERIFGTAATVALALANGGAIFRVHDVRAMRDVADVAQALTRPAKD